MIEILILSNLFIPLISIYIYSYNKYGFKVDHITIFSAGYLYYWMAPIAIYRLDILVKYFLESDFNTNVHISKNVLTDAQLIKYLSIALMIYISFIAGEFISRRINYKYHRIYPFSVKPLLVISHIYFAILILLTIVSYKYYFRGYTMSVFSLKGNVISLNMYLLVLLYMYYFLSHSSTYFRNVFNNNIFIYYVISSILLASLGNRTWIMCGVLSFYIAYTNYYRRISTKHCLLGIISLVLLLGVSAMIRAGDIEHYSLHNIIRLGLYDTFAVHNSLNYYLVNNEIEMLRFPIMLINNLSNIIPLLLMPDKGLLLMNYKDIDVDIISIQAAFHTFPQLMALYGILGSLVISFFSPFFLNYLKYSIYMKASYVVIVAVLAAPFYRDYEGTIVKLIIQICILMPLIYLVLCNCRLNRIFSYITFTK
jgi:hypothetical protein